jgi:hypothetical protein
LVFSRESFINKRLGNRLTAIAKEQKKKNEKTRKRSGSSQPFDERKCSVPRESARKIIK